MRSCCRCFLPFFAFFCLSGTKDVKVFIAYSSILHITVFCVGLANFSAFLVEYFLIPHTLLSGLLFWYLSSIYAFLGVRSLTFFGGLCGFRLWPLAVRFSS